jgi:hypothetical protein
MQGRAPYEAKTPAPVQALITQSDISHTPLPLQWTPWLLQADIDDDSSATRWVLVTLIPHSTEQTILHLLNCALASPSTETACPLEFVTRQLVKSIELEPRAAAPAHITDIARPQPTKASPTHTTTLLPTHNRPSMPAWCTLHCCNSHRALSDTRTPTPPQPQILHREATTRAREEQRKPVKSVRESSVLFLGDTGLRLMWKRCRWRSCGGERSLKGVSVGGADAVDRDADVIPVTKRADAEHLDILTCHDDEHSRVTWGTLRFKALP